MKTYGFIAILCCLMVAGSAWAATGDSFRVTRLPEWQGQRLTPRAMNDRGQVVGAMHAPGGPSHLFLWDRVSGVLDLGPALARSSDINNKGQIVGTVFRVAEKTLAFLRDPDGRVEFIGGAERESVAQAINDQGQVVGRTFNPMRGVYHGFVWDRANGMRELRSPRGGPAQATEISNAGEVFGYMMYHQGIYLQRRSCYWELAESAGAAAVDVPGGKFFSMNGNGWVVGKYTYLNGGAYAVLWHSRGGIEKLFPCDLDDDVFAPLACRVNDANQVVCIEEKRDPWPTRIDATGSREWRCYLWDRARGRIFFDACFPERTCDFTLCDLNNRGCILGIAHLEDADQDIPILLEPVFAKNEDQPDGESSTDVALARQ